MWKWNFFLTLSWCLITDLATLIFPVWRLQFWYDYSYCSPNFKAQGNAYKHILMIQFFWIKFTYIIPKRGDKFELLNLPNFFLVQCCLYASDKGKVGDVALFKIKWIFEKTEVEPVFISPLGEERAILLK